jgi:hypothetical protein
VTKNPDTVGVFFRLSQVRQRHEKAHNMQGFMRLDVAPCAHSPVATGRPTVIVTKGSLAHSKK